MTFEGRQWLYRVFWRLSEMVVLEDVLAEKQALVAAMLITQELRINGRLTVCNGFTGNVKRHFFSQSPSR